MKNQKPMSFAATDAPCLRDDLHSPDEATRARAVRSLCPCHGGWEPFETHRKAVARLTKDESPLVRASALHVLEDAAEMESDGLPTNRREATNPMLRTRRQSRFRRETEEEPRGAERRRDQRKRQSRAAPRPGKTIDSRKLVSAIQ